MYLIASVARGFGSAVRLQTGPAAALVVPARAFSDEGGLKGLKGFTEKERAIENQYFNKEDEKLLRKLLSKVKTVSDVADKHAAVGIAAQEKSSLADIVGKYNMSDADMEALIKWRHAADH